MATSPDLHGTQVFSTSHAKTLTSANHYTTIGEVDNPVIQTSLTKQNGQFQSHKETNVAGGSSTQLYRTSSPAAVTTVTEVITYPAAFSAYKDKKGLSNGAFIKAKEELKNPQNIPPDSSLIFVFAKQP